MHAFGTGSPLHSRLAVYVGGCVCVAASFVGWGGIAGAASAPTGTGGTSLTTGGGPLTTSSVTSSVAASTNPTSDQSIVGIANASSTGYWEVATDGGVFSFNAPYYGSEGGKSLAWPIAGMVATPDHKGYWLYGDDGGVFTFGDAGYYGSEPALDAGWTAGRNETVALVPTQDGKGYWEVNANGDVYSFGDAHYYGTLVTPDKVSTDAVVSATNWGGGYAMLLAGGTAYLFTSSVHSEVKMCNGCDTYNLQAVSITATSNDAGLWAVDVRGQIFSSGNATYEGGLTSIPGGPINAISGWGTAGYRFAGLDGGVFDFELSYEGRAVASSEQSPTYAENVAIGMLAKGGWGTKYEWTTGLYPLWNRESGWEWTVCAGGTHYPNCNYSGTAYGIPQATPGHKMCSYTSTEPPCPSATAYETDAWTQMFWGLWYIHGRYGTPVAANTADKSGTYVVTAA